MGIDIYLNGYEEYGSRIVKEKAAFDAAVKLRDGFPRDSKQHAAAQKKVSAAADEMWSGKVGYLRSSYNGGGLFRVLEEIYGFDIGGYFFPGDWDAEQGVDIIGEEFVARVKALEQTAAIALSRNNLKLPWINEYTEVTGRTAPDVNPIHAQGEAFGDSVFAMISGLGLHKIKGGPREPSEHLLAERHGWYLTCGLKDLREFGLLAMELNKRGERTFAYISY